MEMKACEDMGLNFNQMREWDREKYNNALTLPNITGIKRVISHCCVGVELGIQILKVPHKGRPCMKCNLNDKVLEWDTPPPLIICL